MTSIPGRLVSERERGRPFSVHGSLDFSELRSLGLHPKDVLDFSANVNPAGPSPAARQAITNVSLEQYPDRECLELREALAASLGVACERILPGDGASELIWLLALAFVGPGTRVLVLGPTFSEYARAAVALGASVTTWRAREETDFVPEIKAIAGLLDSLRPQVVLLCNPNNPTGAVLPPKGIAAWAKQQQQTLFVVDEAYLPFSAVDSVLSSGVIQEHNPRLAATRSRAAAQRSARGGEDALRCAAARLRVAANQKEDNVLVLRSMTKDFGLAGLRLGYAVGDERVIARLQEVQPPWSVNALAQAAGVASLRDPAHRQRSLEQLPKAKQGLTEGLTRLGLTPVPSATHFFLVRVGDGTAFRLRLLQRGVLVRDCASFGLPAHIRIATRTPEENERLLAVIREVI